MKLIVLVPALNEEKTISDVVQGVPRDIAGIDQVEVMVIDDGSKDRTAALAREAGARVVSHHKNLGSGASFQTGISNALRLGADVIATIDADLQFNPADIRSLVGHLLDHQLDFVSCSRFLDPENYKSIPLIKRIGNRQVTWFVNMITHRHFTDVSCGFRAYTRDAALRLNPLSEFDNAQETLIILSKGRLRMGEISLPVRGEREYGTSRIAANVLSYGVRCGSILISTLFHSRRNSGDRPSKESS